MGAPSWKAQNLNRKGALLFPPQAPTPKWQSQTPCASLRVSKKLETQVEKLPRQDTIA